MNWGYLLSVWIHILAATIWIGGMGFLVLVIVPLLRMSEYREQAAALVQRSGMKFRTVGWVCLGILVITGTINMHFRGLHWADFFNGRAALNPVAHALEWKLILVAAVLVVSAVHDFYIGPHATALWQKDPTSPEATRFRKWAKMFGRINAVLAVAIVLFAVILVRGGLP